VATKRRITMAIKLIADCMCKIQRELTGWQRLYFTKTFIETEEKHGPYCKWQLKRTAVRRVFGHVKDCDCSGDQIMKN
jgi:hypothetical protein